jgi:hypothetical protein
MELSRERWLPGWGGLPEPEEAAREIAAAEPVDRVRLLPAFDQYVLGPGTRDPTIIDPGRRAGSRVDVTLFPEAPALTEADLIAEARWLEALTGTALTVTTCTTAS